MYGEIVTRLRYKPVEIQNNILTINGTEASLSINPPEIPFPVLSEYEYCTIFLESFETNKDTLYEVKYEIHYKWNELLYKIGEVTSVNGKAEFPRLIKGMSYYVTAIPLDGKYQSKQVRITLDEYDIRQEPVAITTYENSDYKNYDHYLILKNIFGDATVYLEGNPDYISLDRNDKNLRVYLNDENNPDYANFDLVIEDYREEDIIITKKNILVDVPPLPNKNIVFEVPYFILASKLGKDNIDNILNTNPKVGYVGAIAAKPQKNSQNALLYTKDKNSDYNISATIEYSDILELKSPINEIDTQIEIIGSINNVNNNIILLNEELIYITDFDKSFNVLTVKRGVFDTSPKKHSDGSLFVFDLNDIAFDSTQYLKDETIEAQVLTNATSGVQELTVGTEVEIQSRAIRPYPPANAKINGEYYPTEISGDLTLTWVDRNRIQQTGEAPLGFFDIAIPVEDGVTYNAEIYDAQSNIKFAEKLALTSNVVVFEKTELSPLLTRVDLYSMRSGFESYQKYQHIFVWGESPFITAFIANGTFAVPQNISAIDVLIVGGGGGGGSRQGGGGGAGGLIVLSNHSVTPGDSIPIIVGNGGDGGVNGGQGSDGQNSMFGTVVATGGGGGGGRTTGNNGRVGGSGGGSYLGAPGEATGLQGNKGGTGFKGNKGGGGGGAASAGQDNLLPDGSNAIYGEEEYISDAGDGGDGLFFPNLAGYGENGYFAGGGGGGGFNTTSGAGEGTGGAGKGGTGGGGNGSAGSDSPAITGGPGHSAMPNTGGGGGGSAGGNFAGGSGGSGIVIIVYPAGQLQPIISAKSAVSEIL